MKETEKKLREIQDRVTKLSVLNFRLEFSNMAAQKAAQRIENGYMDDNKVIHPPNPFIRSAEFEHKSSWENLMSALGGKYIDGEIDLDEVKEGVSEQMLSDYQETAERHKISEAIIEAMEVEC